jgi:hypothetical protein
MGEPVGAVAAAERLRESLVAWAQAEDFGAVLPVRTHREAASLSFEIVHEDRRATVVLQTRDGAAIAPREHRALRSHLVTFDASHGRGRLTITTDLPEIVTPLARFAGDALFGDPRGFLDAPAVDLSPLQERGPAALHIPELAAKATARAIGGTWHSGKGHAITPRGRDFFKALARYKIRIEGGRLDLVTVRATRPAGEPGPPTCDVVMSPPHHLTVSEPELAPLMHEMLDRARITRPEARPRDFFSCQPWIDTPATWTAREGEGGFAALVARGVLKADSSNRGVASPEHPHAGRTATAYPLGGKKYLAWSPDPTIAPFVVLEKDLLVYSLDFGAVAAMVAEAMGLDAPAARLDDDGVLHCGRRTLGPTFVHVFLLTRPIRPATVARLGEAAGHGHAILVLPEARRQAHGLRQLAMPALAGPWQPLLDGIVRTLRLTQHVDTIVYAPADARVVVDRARGFVWVDGVLCEAVKETHVRLLDVLITRGPQLYTKEIADYVAQGHAHADTTRRAIETFVSAVKRSFKAQKRTPPRDLAGFITMRKHGYYALGVKGFVD